LYLIKETVSTGRPVKLTVERKALCIAVRRVCVYPPFIKRKTIAKEPFNAIDNRTVILS
jgi:hypothetical protein